MLGRALGRAAAVAKRWIFGEWRWIEFQGYPLTRIKSRRRNPRMRVGRWALTGGAAARPPEPFRKGRISG